MKNLFFILPVLILISVFSSSETANAEISLINSDHSAAIDNNGLCRPEIGLPIYCVTQIQPEFDGTKNLIEIEVGTSLTLRLENNLTQYQCVSAETGSLKSVPKSIGSVKKIEAGKISYVDLGELCEKEFFFFNCVRDIDQFANSYPKSSWIIERNTKFSANYINSKTIYQCEANAPKRSERQKLIVK